MIDYSWVPWFEELAIRIAEGGERYLIKKAFEVDWGNGKKLLDYGEDNIDPMSFFYFLSGKNTKNNYEFVFQSVHDKFGIRKQFPKNRPIIPSQRQNALFHDSKSFNPELLWRLFSQATSTNREPAIQSECFNSALNIPEVAITKLTQTLFIVRPSYFLPVDKRIRAALPKFGAVDTYEGYVDAMSAIKDHFPGCHSYDIYTFLSAQEKTPLITAETRFFQVSTDVDDDRTDCWERNDGGPENYENRRAFNKYNQVYTGGPGQEIIYPLAEPKRGDIILVRFDGEGRAIGVVEENDYDPEGWNEDGAIHVYWINKTSAEIEGELPNVGFSKAEQETQMAFRSTVAYAPSFELIDHWNPASAEPSSFDDRGTSEGDGEAPRVSETSTTKSDTSLSLNTILFGPPGTGKTWEAVSWAVAIVYGEEPEELVRAEDREDVKARYDELREKRQVELVTFHQSYAYEDFVEGIGPVLDHNNELLYELRDGIFKQISSRAQECPSKRFVLVIDEINRGNIARIFGELITLIEPSKRADGEDAAVVTLPHSGRHFSVPGNLYLVGTMNTADRGIALLDSALRRRFDFVERMPKVDLVREDIGGVNGQDLLQAINDRITVYLDREHQIGHIYLIGVETISDLAEAFQRRIVPLLQEYFYDDWAKIRSVLNENPFVQERRIETSIPGDRPERPVYELLPQVDGKWREAGSYQRIYAREQTEGAG